MFRVSTFCLFSFFIVLEAGAQTSLIGNIISNENTVTEVSILKKTKIKSDSSLFFDFISITDEKGTIKRIYPKDIKGFNFKNRTFITKKIQFTKGSDNIFCEQIVIGNASLYYYKGIHSDNEEIYIFNRKSDSNFYYIKTSAETKVNSGYSESSQAGLPQDLSLQRQVNDLIFGITNDKSFEYYFTRYFGDCELIRSKLKQQWYIGYNAKALFTDFNKECKE